MRQVYAVYVPRMGREPRPMQVDYAERIARGGVFVTPSGTGLSGVLVLAPAPPDALMVENVAVAAAAQGAGLGRALLSFAESEARRAGLRRLVLYTNENMTENRTIYPHLGFTETHREPLEGSGLVWFEKRLT